ncbi:zinc metalloprotease HtpX [Desulfovibrio subterraneus]|jgi:heat shock protein HtpX|uniref:Protease HtpX homolog n=1 Tax=Desulfovibrio subterraneus TaxID=2718620 RepID=A0A7J0BL44_9BACT|nr:zinc metalloprotease HtpX [Desulfovibrio subterraneus]WBF68414.1 zinc metalloprotease HtpX [Desulfovibrio subterraneus]GFM34369.1 protease HtpX [Desulfovibrio subterraneus]
MTSNLKTVMLLALLSGIIIFLGGAMGGKTGLVFAFGLALIMNVGSYWYSDKIVLRMYNAQEVDATDAPALHRMVEELARNAGIPKPRICVIPEDAPNAFATGRNPEHGVVAVTSGIMRLLSPEELKGVLAHEIGHIANRDILVQSVAGVLASAIVTVANMMQWMTIFGMGGSNNDEEGGSNPFTILLLAILAPVAASLIQFAISRSREYLADDTGARLAGNPLYLASALEKLGAYSQQVPMRAGNEATAHMFIVNPFAGANLARLFSTHPPIEERVQRLREMARAR